MSKPPAGARRLHWDGQEFIPAGLGKDEALEAAALLVADSWLLDEGSMLGAALHRERFAAGAAAAGEALPARLWDAALAALPRTGSWFPRIELLRSAGRPHFALMIRPAPERSGPLILRSWEGPDLRQQPTVKGPDLAALAPLRDWARTHGADEAVLLDDAGRIIEGATTSLLWWRGESLHAVPAAIPRIAGVTERALRTIAAVTGTEVVEEHSRPDGLEGCEVWAVNALHGIRVVRGWQLAGGPGEQQPQLQSIPGRAQAWRARLTALRRSLSQGAPRR